MDIAEVVLRLTGPVEPVGDSRADEIRLENLRALCDVAEVLLDRIALVADAYGDHMASVKAAKDHAAKFLASARTSIGNPPAPQSKDGGEGVPAFDPTQPCILNTNDPTPAYCTRCKSPHHACDGGSGDSEANKEKG